MSMASVIPARLAASLPAKVLRLARFATRHRRRLALAFLGACILQGAWQGFAVHREHRRNEVWWVERAAALHGAMALANVVANIAEEPGEWSLMRSGEGRTVLRKGAAIRVLSEAIAKPDSRDGADVRMAKILLPNEPGAVPVVWVAGGSRRLCTNLLGHAPSTYLGKRLELGIYDGKSWSWIAAWGPPARIHQACDALPPNPDHDSEYVPGPLDPHPLRTFGLRLGVSATGSDPKVR